MWVQNSDKMQNVLLNAPFFWRAGTVYLGKCVFTGIVFHVV